MSSGDLASLHNRVGSGELKRLDEQPKHPNVSLPVTVGRRVTPHKLGRTTFRRPRPAGRIALWGNMNNDRRVLEPSRYHRARFRL
jgi:hypothetical protein